MRLIPYRGKDPGVAGFDGRLKGLGGVFGTKVKVSDGDISRSEGGRVVGKVYREDAIGTRCGQGGGETTNNIGAEEGDGITGDDLLYLSIRLVSETLVWSRVFQILGEID